MMDGIPKSRIQPCGVWLCVCGLLISICFLDPHRAGAQGIVRVKDINPDGVSNPMELTDVNGTLFFSANDGTSGQELWKSDGTAGGTSMVRDIWDGMIGGFPFALTNINGTLYFSANDGVHGSELWKANSGGAVMIKDINPDPNLADGNSNPGGFTAFRGQVFFAAWDGTLDTNRTRTIQLWRTDGTEGGTVLVKTFFDVGVTPGLGGFIVFGDKLYFVLGGFNINRNQIWRSDGTEAGTEFVSDGLPTGVFLPAGFTPFKGFLYFSTQAGLFGVEMWRTDGTTQGTMLFKDIFEGTDSSFARDFTPVGNTLFFRANQSSFTNLRLWKTDGTPNGTVLVNPMGFERETNNLVARGTKLFFTANSLGFALFKTNGTVEGTSVVHQFERIGNVVNIRGTLYFAAKDAENGMELWKSDGTPDGTFLIEDLAPGLADGFNSEVPVASGTKLFVVPNTFDAELYVVNGRLPPPTPTPLPQTAPRLIDAIAIDRDRDVRIGPGDLLALVFDQGVRVNPLLLNPLSFFLPVTGDQFVTPPARGNNRGTIAFLAEANPFNSRRLILRLGPGGSLTPAGQFDIGVTAAGSPSGIDLSAAIDPQAIVGRINGLSAVDGGEPMVDDSGIDIRFALAPNSRTIDETGGTLALGVSGDVVYTKHSIHVPAGALPPVGTPRSTRESARGTPLTFGVQDPAENLGVAGAVQFTSSDPGVTFSIPATLTIEYLDDDVDIEDGQVEPAMRINQLVDLPPDGLRWTPVQGAQTIDTDNNTVTVEINSLNPEGSIGEGGVFANLAGETIQKQSTFIKPQAGARVVVTRRGSPTSAGGGLDSIYTQTRVEFPNFAAATQSDPDRIEVILEKPSLLDKFGTDGGQGFPFQSSALTIVRTLDAGGSPMAFTDPVDVFIEFLDGTAEGLNGFDDLVDFDQTPRPAENMRLVMDGVDGSGIDYQFWPGSAQSVAAQSGGGVVEAHGITNLTGASGSRAWGAVALVELPPPTVVHEFDVYE